MTTTLMKTPNLQNKCNTYDWTNKTLDLILVHKDKKVDPKITNSYSTIKSDTALYQEGKFPGMHVQFPGILKEEFIKKIKYAGYCDSNSNDLSPLNIALIITSSLLFIALLISLFIGKSKGKSKGKK